MSVELSKIELEYHELPADWAWIKLGEVCNPINGRAFKSSDWKNHGLPIIRIQNLKKRNATFNYYEGKPDEKHLVRAGDLLFAWSGTPGTSFGAHIWNGPLAVLNQHIFRIEFDDQQLDPKYFLYALNQNVTRYVQQAQGGVGLAHITKRKFLDSQIPIAPITDQKRIVAEIEKQFSRLDEAVTSLKRAKTNLKRYKAAVLKAAVEGKLTEEWRKQNPDIEPASELLKRILAERRSKWEEAELVKMRAKGKEPTDDDWTVKYEEPNYPILKALPSLPEQWIWTSGNQIASKIVDGTHHTPTYVDFGIPFISVKDVKGDKIHFENCKYIGQDEHNQLIRRCHPEKDDVVITKSGTIGRTAVIETNKEFSLFVSVALIKRSSDLILPLYLKFMLDAYIQSINIQQTVKGGLIKNLHLEDLRVVPLCLAPVEEQHQIISIIERYRSIIEKYENLLFINIKRVERLRQSILENAFSGKITERL